MRNGIFHLLGATALAIALSASSAYAQKKYDTGATDTEIKIGQTVPFCGPASAYASIGKTQAAYFKMINEQGGINGRKINLIQYDDAYSPPKAVEQVRKLVESDEVLLTFQIVGTPSNAAVQKYLNAKKVPQLFAATGASKFTDPKNFPWTHRLQPQLPGRGTHLRPVHSQKPSERQDRHPLSERRSRPGLPERPQGRPRRQGGQDDRGRSLLRSLRSDHRFADPQDQGRRRRPVLQRLDAEAGGAGDQEDRASSAGIRFTSSTSTPRSVGAVMQPAGLEASKGVISVNYGKDPRRSALEGRPRHEEVLRLHGEVLSRWRQELELQHLWLFDRAIDGACAQAVRRRPDARERDEAGHQSEERRARSGAARHEGQHHRRTTIASTSRCR